MARTSTVAFASALIGLATAAALLAMGRPPICTCGTVALWGPVGPTQSQMLADWYSFSHLVHGFLFYALLWLVARRWPARPRFVAALLVEAIWEMIENSPAIIDYYRTTTVALGYSGDSMLNSLSDVAMMAVGFLIARKAPLWVSVVLVLLFELVPLLVIRDNLTLNILMFLHPDPSIVAWQSRA